MVLGEHHITDMPSHTSFTHHTHVHTHHTLSYSHSCSAHTHTQGEDKWVEAPGNKWELHELGAAAGFSAFGVFDGHGGKNAASVSGSKYA